jgi:hypothetical protein
MSTLERVILYAVLVLAIVVIGQQYVQNKNIADLTAEVRKAPIATTTPAQPVIAVPQATTTPPQTQGEFMAALTNLIPFKITDFIVKEGGRLENASCSDGSTVFSQGDKYKQLSAGGNGLYIQNSASLRAWNEDFNDIRAALIADGYVQCTNESEINFPWPQIGYKKGDKGAWLIGTSPRGVEGSIDLSLEE